MQGWAQVYNNATVYFVTIYYNTIHGSLGTQQEKKNKTKCMSTAS